MSSDTSEKGFQNDIIAYLTSTGYVKRTTNDYDVVSCLDIELVLMCEILEASDEKLDEYFKLFDAQVEMRKVEQLEKLKDMNSDSIFFLNIDKFKENIESAKIVGVREQVKEFFDFANKALDKKAYAYAEKYYD